MTADERLDEVARILAAGIARRRARLAAETAKKNKTFGEVCLDFPGDQSRHDQENRRDGER